MQTNVLPSWLSAALGHRASQFSPSRSRVKRQSPVRWLLYAGLLMSAVWCREAAAQTATFNLLASFNTTNGQWPFARTDFERHQLIRYGSTRRRKSRWNGILSASRGWGGDHPGVL